MHGLNKQFVSSPVTFLNDILLVTRKGSLCPTCHRPISLSHGHSGWANEYFRPEPTIFTFDLIGGAYAGQINAGVSLLDMLEGQLAVPLAVPPIPPIPPQVPAAGLSYQASRYATMLPIKMGEARTQRKVGWLTTENPAYWLPWANQNSVELHLNNPNVRFFFTAMFSGCTFAVAIPPGVDGAANVWVTHIAWDPGAAILPAWGGLLLPPASAVTTKRLAHEAAFYQTRLGLGQPIRTVTSDPAPLISGVLGLGGPGLAAVPVVHNAAMGIGSKRISYGQYGRAFIVGWRDRHNAWHFAVQKQPHGTTDAGIPLAVTNHYVRPLFVEQFL